MTVPPNDSVFWMVARQAILAVLLSGFAIFAYQNKMSMTDVGMIFTTMASIFGIDLVKRTAAPK